MDEMIRHKDIVQSGRWGSMEFIQQMANVGSEVFRASKWKDKGKDERALSAAERSLELLDLTLADIEPNRTRELFRLRELICDYFYGENEYESTGETLNRYFDYFSMKAAKQRSNGL